MGRHLSRRQPGARMLAAAVWLGAAAAAPGTVAPRAAPDVVLVTVDTLRADALGFMGNPRAATPVLDRWAAGGRVFVRAHAHNVVTLPSHANILTGLYPFQHGVRDNSGFRLPPGVPTLAEILRAAGYATAAFVAALPLDSDYGLDRGFERYDDDYPKGARPTEFALPERRGDVVIAAALDWWRSAGEAAAARPRFLWVHLYDPHAPYAPAEPFASRFREAPYAGEVAAVDSYLRPLLEPGPEPGGPGRARLVILTSDHGEGLGAHGEQTHGLFAYEPTLHVPLVVWGPALGVVAGRDDRPAGHVDIFPTVLDAAGVAAPPPAAPRMRRVGRSLLEPAPAGDDAERSLYFEALSTNLNRGWAPLRGLLRGDRKAISLPIPEQYDLAADPVEADNRAPREALLTEELLRGLPRESIWPPVRAAAGGGGGGGETEEQAAALRSLGYVSGSAPPRDAYGPEDDPKNLVALDDAVHRLIDAYSRGQMERAVDLGRQVVAARPSMPLGRSLLAQALLEANRRTEALEVMLEARRQGIVTEGLLRQLALTLAEAGRAAEAVEILAPWAEAGDAATRSARVTALLEAGRLEEAAVAIDGALAADPRDARAFAQRALLELRRGRAPAARLAAEEAVRLNPALALAWNYLGVARFQGGDRAGAVDAWQRAADVDPRLWDAWWNLGLQAAGLGRREQAAAALRRFVEGAPASDYGGDLERARAMLASLLAPQPKGAGR